MSLEFLPSNQNQAFSDYTFITKYARYNRKKKRRETWDEAVERVCDMHLQRYGSRGIEDDISWAFEMVRNKKVLPSMRSLQFGGEAILANDARMYNCAFTHANRSRFFSEALWMLLSGVGVGFSVQKHHVEQLPDLIEHQPPEEKEIFTYTVADTIEGWADALDVLMSTYFARTPNSGREVFFDFSKIRRKGTWLKTSGGRAPGAAPLRLALKRIKKILREAVEQGYRKLIPVQVYDIAMMSADAVLSGGVRRSATIAIFSEDDEEMMRAKTFFTRGQVLSHKRNDGTWLVDYGEGAVSAWYLKKDNSKVDEPERGDEVNITWSNIMPWRARSNNSVALLRSNCTKKRFEEIVKNAKIYGEPGFVFLDSLEYGFNPCFSGDMRLLTKDGYKTIEELWEQGGSQEYDKYKSADEYGLINIVNSHGVVKATNIYRTSKNSPIYEVELANGQSVKATANHKFLRLNINGEKERVRLDELKIGDKLPLIPETSFGDYHNPEYGLLAGWVAGDGSLSKNSNGLQRAHIVVYEKDLDDCLPVLRDAIHALYAKENKSSNQNPLYEGCEQTPKEFNFKKKTMESLVLGRMMLEDGCKCGIPSEKIKSTKHKVPNRIWKADKETICAYLKGIFSADGTVNISNFKKSCSVKLWQANKEFLKEIQLLLLQLNITSSINHRRKARKVLMNDGKGGEKLYNSKDQYEIYIGSRENFVKFVEKIGFLQNYKNEKLKIWLSNNKGTTTSNTKYYSKIKSIKIVDNKPTYCLTEPENNEVCVQGIVMMQCVEIGLNPIDPATKESGWQVCNLTEINGGAIKTKEDFKQAVKAATIIGTLQAGYSYFHYLTDVSRRIIRRERLLGVSVTGWMENPEFLLDPELQQEMAKYAVEVNKEYAECVGIEPAARVTCTKPAGSTSIILGTSSGIHPHHARRFFRRIQQNSVQMPLQYFKLWNPQAVEGSVWGKNDEVITFCLEVPDSAVIKGDLTAIEFLDKVRNTYKNWVLPGTAKPESSPKLTHNVSNTVHVADDEWDEVIDYIYKYRDCFSGIALIPKAADKVYEQAPNECVITEEDIKRWNNLVQSFHSVDWTTFQELDDFTSARETIACAGGSCEI